jgi:diaminopimelate decarboxylase
MDHFEYRNDHLFAEGCSLKSIAELHGTPCYVYSRATLEKHWHAFNDGFGDKPHLICYAVKANSNIAILNLLARLGSGFDIVSVGELERVLKAGGEASKIVFSGVGKRDDELRRALEVGIRCFNVEVPGEFDRLNKIAAEMGKIAPVSLRVNPDVDAKTHPYISTGLKENKFGIDIDYAVAEYKRAAQLPNLNIVGIDCHIGSQLTEITPFLDALDRVLLLAEALEQEGIAIKHLDLGGGLGIRYQNETPTEPAVYIEALYQKLGDVPYEILLEPGRAIAGNAGILLTAVEYLKPTESKNFAIVDAAMNDLMRPALYGAWQDIVPAQKRHNGETERYDIVGPICETGDFLGKERQLNLQQGDLLAIRSAGAYGFTMSSNYNSRPRPVEIMVDGCEARVIRKRESLSQLWEGEQLLP